MDLSRATMEEEREVHSKFGVVEGTSNLIYLGRPFASR
jgi:hypothetical protein